MISSYDIKEITIIKVKKIYGKDLQHLPQLKYVFHFLTVTTASHT